MKTCLPLRRPFLALLLLLAAGPALAKKDKDKDGGGKDAPQIEIKYLVKAGAAEHASAWKILDGSKEPLSAKPFTEEEVCFFETSPASLDPVILRARKRFKPGKKDPTQIKLELDSTVKVRMKDGDTHVPGPVEAGITPETDASGPNKIVTSRSADWPDGKDDKDPGPTLEQFDGAVYRHLPASALFQGPNQPGLIKERLNDLDWSTLKPCGPIHARVWKSFHLSDAYGDVTVEDWTLDRPGGEALQLLELSIKIDLPADPRPAVEAFFKAVEQAHFPPPEPATKTASVLRYYLPAGK